MIGILGGMGPMATVDLFEKIVRFTPAKSDQEHLPILIFNNPQIPSRMTAITEGTESPLPELIKSARLLESNKVDFILLPCNTAHYWIKDVQATVQVEIVNMIENAANHIKQFHPGLSGKIMLLATTATAKMKLYEKAFEQAGLRLLAPSEEEQSIVEKVIHDIKAGHAENNAYLGDLKQLMLVNSQQGIEAYIGGCTEIPLIFPFVEGFYQKFDPTELLAKYAVTRAMTEKKKI